MKTKIVLTTLLLTVTSLCMAGDIDEFLPEVIYGGAIIDSAFYDYPEDNIHRKYILSYDNNGYCVSIIEYERDKEQTSWCYYRKKVLTYDNNGNRTSDIDFDWDTEKNKWQEDYKHEYKYDAVGNKTSEITYSWNEEINAWEGSSKYEYTYDIYGKMTSEAYWTWDEETNDWKGYYKYLYTYDNKNISVRDSYYWDNEKKEWDSHPNESIEYTYDEQGNEILAIMSNVSWDEETKSFEIEPRYKIETTYDNHQNVTLYINYTWNSEIADWEIERGYKYVYTYDANERVKTETDYSWDLGKSTWKDVGRIEYSYDAKGNVILEDEYFLYERSWDEGNPSSWEHQVTRRIFDVYDNLIYEIENGFEDYQVQLFLHYVNGNVIVEPTETKATFTWQSVSYALSYSLILWLDEEHTQKVCTINFDSEGHFIGIEIIQQCAPSQSNEDDFIYTIENLLSGTNYFYQLLAYDEELHIINTHIGAFSTQGIANSLNETEEMPKSKSHKVLFNGQILIIRGDKTYTITGQEVK